MDLIKTRGIQRVIFMLHNYRVSWGCPNQTRTVYFGDWVHQFSLEDAQWRHEVAPLRALPRASVLPSLATIAPNPRELVPEVNLRGAAPVKFTRMRRSTCAISS